jgi:hypothetical protein
MITQYIDKAMRLAEYEIIEDGTFWGRIPGYTGVWAIEPTLEACRNELQSTLEDWLLLKLWDNDDDIPVVGKLCLVPGKKQAKRGSRLKTPAHTAS